MSTTPVCPSCRKALEPNAPRGLCPECLLKAGFPSGTEASEPRPSFEPPGLEELAARLPQFELLGLLGRGGMGAVYKARQKELDRLVALKILPPAIGQEPGFADRFAREAKALAKLNHPNIVTLYEFAQADGLIYFIMEFVDGVNLRELLQAGRLAPREALAIVPQICDALQYAHDQGIVHRDIKPENILLDRKGRVKVADFGLARLVGLDDARATALSHQTAEGAVSSVPLTEAGKVMGTPHYMSPEQRERPAEVDHRADIYSLGVVFYQMLTGELPNRKIEPPSKKVTLDVRLDEVVLRALEKEPERRYQQASQIRTQIETIAGNAPGAEHSAHSSRDKSAPQMSGALWPRRAVVLAAVLMLAPFVLFGGAMILYQFTRAARAQALAQAALEAARLAEAASAKNGTLFGKEPPKPKESEDAGQTTQQFIVHGRVTDEQGNGLPGVIVTANCGAGTLLRTGEAQTDDSGSYILHFSPGMRIKNETTGNWGAGVQAATIHPAKSGYFDANLNRQGDLLMADRLPTAGENVGWKVDTNKIVLPGQPFLRNFVMLPAATIEGLLRDENGAAILGWGVCLSGENLPPSSSVFACVDTDANGRFVLSNAPTTGRWWLEAYRHADRRRNLPASAEFRSERFTLGEPGKYEFKAQLDEADPQHHLKIEYRGPE